MWIAVWDSTEKNSCHDLVTLVYVYSSFHSDLGHSPPSFHFHLDHILQKGTNPHIIKIEKQQLKLNTNNKLENKYRYVIYYCFKQKYTFWWKYGLLNFFIHRYTGIIFTFVVWFHSAETKMFYFVSDF